MEGVVVSTGLEGADKTAYEDILSSSALTQGVQPVREIEPGDSLELAELLRTQAIMLDQTHDAIIVRNREDHIQFWNRGAERLYGWSANEAIGKNMYELLSLTSIYEDPGIFAENGECAVEMRQVTKDSRQVIVESRSRVLRDETGHPTSVLIVNTDVTESKLLESQFLRAQRMETIGRLASGIVHDLNKVLSPMLLATRILRAKKMEREDRQWLDTLKINAEHAGGLITQLMSLARGIEGERTPIQLRHLIHETVGVLKRVFPESISIKTRIATRREREQTCSDQGLGHWGRNTCRDHRQSLRTVLFNETRKEWNGSWAIDGAADRYKSQRSNYRFQ